ncbi:MAG TPA: YgaP-like transmembrane domain [Verrucomicrobiae bacterium]|nr:YgaP-like transmembrane domain [Verrucomicrobiae bacterium]
MSRFFRPNLDRPGRMARGVVGSVFLIAGVIVGGDVLWWAGLILVAAGLFAIFEAISNWCVMRACGIRTKF